MDNTEAFNRLIYNTDNNNDGLATNNNNFYNSTSSNPATTNNLPTQHQLTSTSQQYFSHPQTSLHAAQFAATATAATAAAAVGGTQTIQGSFPTHHDSLTTTNPNDDHQYFQQQSSSNSPDEVFILRCIMPRLAIPILMDEKISKFFSNNSNFVLSIENQASQLPYAIFEIELGPDRVIPISIFLNKIINGKPVAPFLNDIVIKDVPKNFIYQSKFLLPEVFFNDLIVQNEELNKMIHKTLISVSILPDCDEILIRVSSNVLKNFFFVILKEIEIRFTKFSKFNQHYYYNSQTEPHPDGPPPLEEPHSFIKFHKNKNQDLYVDKIILKSYYCGSLFRNFANFKYTLRTKSDCNLKIQRILVDEQMGQTSKDDDIMFIVYGPYQHNVEFAIKMIENYTKKYAHLKLNQEFDQNTHNQNTS